MRNALLNSNEVFVRHSWRLTALPWGPCFAAAFHPVARLAVPTSCPLCGQPDPALVERFPPPLAVGLGAGGDAAPLIHRECSRFQAVAFAGVRVNIPDTWRNIPQAVLKHVSVTLVRCAQVRPEL